MKILGYVYRVVSNFAFLALVYYSLNFMEKYHHRAIVAILVLVYASMRGFSALRSFYFFQKIERLELEVAPPRRGGRGGRRSRFAQASRQRGRDTAPRRRDEVLYRPVLSRHGRAAMHRQDRDELSRSSASFLDLHQALQRSSAGLRLLPAGCGRRARPPDPRFSRRLRAGRRGFPPSVACAPCMACAARPADSARREGSAGTVRTARRSRSLNSKTLCPGTGRALTALSNGSGIMPGPGRLSRQRNGAGALPGVIGPRQPLVIPV